MPVLQEQKPVIAAWRAAGVLDSVLAAFFSSLPRLAGMTSPRQR